MKRVFILAIALFGASRLFSKNSEMLTVSNEQDSLSWYMHRALNALSKTVTENPIFSIIGSYYLLFDHKAIEDNTFWSAVFGACLLATFVKNLISPDKYPKNFIAKTIIEHPFFSFIAGHMLLLHRDKIKQYPLEAMIVGGVLIFDLAANYQEEYENKDQEIIPLV